MAAVAVLKCPDHFGRAEGKCAACRRVLCLECPHCGTCGRLACPECDTVRFGWLCAACRPVAPPRAGGPAHGPEGPRAAAGRGSRGDGDSVFGAVDRMVYLTLGVLGAVAVLVGAAWAVTALTGARSGGETVAVAAPDGQIGNPNVLRDPSAVAGLRTVDDDGPSVDLRALVDWQTGERAPVWRSAMAVLPLELRLRTRQVAPPASGAPPAGPPMVARAVFAHSLLAAPETWARDVEVWALAGPDEPAQQVGAWPLERRTGAQEFAFTRRRVWEVWLRVLSNHGGAPSTTLAEFALLP